MYGAAALFDLATSLEYVVLEHVPPRPDDLVPSLLTLLMLVGPALMFFARSRRANWLGVLWLVPFVALATADWSIRI